MSPAPRSYHHGNKQGQHEGALHTLSTFQTKTTCRRDKRARDGASRRPGLRYAFGIILHQGMGSQHQIDHGIASRSVALEACGRQSGPLKSQSTGMAPRASVCSASGTSLPLSGLSALPGSLVVTLCYREESRTHQAARISCGFARRDKYLIGELPSTLSVHLLSNGHSMLVTVTRC
jgi:hypothetical protein